MNTSKNSNASKFAKFAISTENAAKIKGGVDYGLMQETDATGRPSSIVRGGKIEITVESTGDTDLFELM